MAIDKYSKAFAEVKMILNYTDQDLVNRIPQSFQNFIEDNYDKEYIVPSITTEKKLDEQGLLDETMTILSIIYRNYWCDEMQREEYDKIIKQNEDKFQEELREKYNPDNLFKKEDIEIVSVDEKTEIENEIKNALIEYKEESLLKKIFNKIKGIFGL